VLMISGLKNAVNNSQAYEYFIRNIYFKERLFINKVYEMDTIK